MKTTQRRHDIRRGGFTLLEVLLVLAILGVIAAMVVPNLLGSQRKAMVDATTAKISQLETDLGRYAADHGGEFPQNITMLREPVDDRGNPMTAYVDKIPADAWNQPLMYEYPNTRAPRALRPAIWSVGANRQNEEGAGDDINNWHDLAQ
jgi:general secretion pathway protein G